MPKKLEENHKISFLGPSDFRNHPTQYTKAPQKSWQEQLASNCSVDFENLWRKKKQQKTKQ